MKRFVYAVLSSLLLYSILWVLDQFFQTTTALLLLNVDFIYSNLPFVLELSLHVLVGIVVYYVLSSFYRYITLYQISFIICLVVFAGLYFQLTHLAVTDVLTLSINGYIIWLIGHFFYLMVVHLLIRSG
ncbi:hypothetical protein [Macrococcus carouselicus]|uniref:Uncharacterized protein n=1 Tax=Macrococcus carouselicus TaxID=69969 RepID=A0A9Q8CHH9_9STAP|nr:hypothetical protein [Macrococcus carouselicus]TDM02241.1 hypothetical protein ERX40_06720 [Macrococcus carouselicus]